MRFDGVCIISSDVDRLRDFYADALRTEAEGSSIFSTVATKGTALTIYSREGMERMAPGSMDKSGSGNWFLEFEVDDVDREFERLRTQNIPIVKPPSTQPWGRRSVWFRDPDGNLINFYALVPSTVSRDV